MVQQSIPILTNALNAVIEWFDTCIESIGGAKYLIAIVFMVLAYKYILSPVLGEVGSDIAYERRKSRRSNDSEKGGKNG